jgi:hypothetical protein
MGAIRCPIRNLISEQVDPVNGNAFFANAGSLNLRGFDLSISKTLPGRLDGTVSYSSQDAESPSTCRQRAALICSVYSIGVEPTPETECPEVGFWETA